jgi:acyl dehydratase
MASTGQAAPVPARFADVQVGQTLPPLVCGPLSTVHLMRWSAAIENWHRIHFDEPFARGHDGLPRLLVSGSWKQHFAIDLMWRWLRPHGWVAGVELRFSRPNFAGDTLTATGVVTAVEVRGDLGFVDCDFSIRNAGGEENTSGKGIGVLPIGADRRVCYPYVPPAGT